MKKPSATKPKQLTARGLRTRHHILSVSAQLIYQRGAEATSLDEVCEGAQVSRSQLYHYFANKQALVESVIELQAERVLAEQEGALRHLDSPHALRAWAKLMLTLYRSTGGGCPLGSLASELSGRSEPARICLLKSFDLWRDRIAVGLTTMQRAGEIASTAKPAELATAMIAALQGGLLMAKTQRNEAPLVVALDMALAYAFGAPDPPRRHR